MLCVALQVFQCSEQTVQLHKDGWFVPEEEPSGISKMRNPKEPRLEWPIIVASEWQNTGPFGPGARKRDKR